MYNNLIYVLIILLIYTTYQPVDEPWLPGWAGLICIVGLFFLYSRLVLMLFRRRYLAHLEGRGGSPGKLYHDLVNRFMILALFFFAAAVYIFGLKDLLMILPIVQDSTAMSGIMGLGCFAVFLVIMWRETFKLYSRVFRSRLTRDQYIWSQLRFNFPIVLPYLFLTGIWDIISGLLPSSSLRDWILSPVGESVLVIFFMLVMVLLFPLVVRSFWGLTPLPPGPKRDVIEQYCRNHGFYYRDIMLWPLYEGEALTAGVMGLHRRFRYILVTKSLLDILDREELEAVVGHELGHIKRKHLIYYFLFFLGFMVLTTALSPLIIYVFPLSDWAMNMLLASDGNPETGLSLLLGLPTMLLLVVYFRFVIGVFLRNFERQADLFSYRLNGTIQGLTGSLEKIAFHSGQSRSMPSWHHYSVAQRVDFLKACERNPSLVQRHDSKVRKMLLVYGLCLALLAGGGYYFENSSMGLSARLNLQEKSLRYLLRENPENGQILRFLGDIYFQREQWDLSVDFYERAMSLNPNDPDILNGLAWTLVTRKDATRADLEKALPLAQKAVSLKEAPYILDTLAEALFVNGRPQEALVAIDQAIKLIGPMDDREYYLKQREKFHTAL